MPLLQLEPPAILTGDPWHRWDGTAAPSPRVVVPLEQLRTLATPPQAVALEPEDDPQALEPHLPHLALVVLRFAFLHDGRPYSQARILRERLGFAGELRAVGKLALDLVPYLGAAGFTTAEIEGIGADELAALARIRQPWAYAPTAALPAIWRARHPEVAHEGA